MPGEEEKLPRCPKGERRNKKTKKCVKVEKKAKTPSPKRTTMKVSSPKKNSKTRKTPSPKKNSVKAPSPKKSPPKDIPYLSSMKDLDSYSKSYVKVLLVKMSNIIQGKSPTGVPKNPTYYYVSLSTLNRFLQDEINNLEIKHESRGYIFPEPDDIIFQLQRLKIYFKHIANKKDHVSIDRIAELYRK